MKFSGKMCFEIILKVTKNQGFTFSFEETFFEKPQGGQFDPPPGRLDLINKILIFFSWCFERKISAAFHMF